MAINRRRAPSSQISHDKKMEGHQAESEYARLIGAQTISGTGKSDVEDLNGSFHSVKSGKKWQVFLYGHDRISNSEHLKILEPSLNAFTEDAEKYFEDRIKCISFKEAYVKKHGRLEAKKLENSKLIQRLSPNEYMESKARLALANEKVVGKLKDKKSLSNFLGEALFNKKEVNYLAIRDDTFKQDGRFKVFSRAEVLEILAKELSPALSAAGKVVEDYNVDRQKTLLKYTKKNGREKNIVEIEIRNDSLTHYRQVRFNMYSKDTLSILLNNEIVLPVQKFNDQVWLYGTARKSF
jgi:hypothetical protein